MVSKLQKLLNLSLKTFNLPQYQVNDKSSNFNIDKLYSYFSKINLNDEIDLSFIEEANKLIKEFNSFNIPPNDYNRQFGKFLREKENNYGKNKFLNIKIYIKSVQTKTPVLHMEIFEKRSYVSLSMFLIRRGFNIPLHNHPNMHGLGKVIYGNGEVRSYTLIETKGSEIMARCESIKQVNCGEMLLLEPISNNVHEIAASYESDLVFIDLIVPPYESNCSFYEISSQNNDNLVHFKLLEKSPSSYFCDSLIYNGPKLNIED